MSTRLLLQNIHLTLGEQAVLRGIDLRVSGGEMVGLIGPNGSGKSSLMRVCAGLLRADSGQVSINDIDVRLDELGAKRRLGYSVEPERLPANLLGRQGVELIAGVRGLDQAAVSNALTLAEELGLTPWMDRQVAIYSLGTRQKLAVLLALLGDPPLLLLDEVLNGLDPLAAYTLKQVLRQRSQNGAAVLLATHGLEVAERFLDRAVLLIDGRIEADWGSADLAAFRRDPQGGLEHAVAERLRAR